MTTGWVEDMTKGRVGGRSIHWLAAKLRLAWLTSALEATDLAEVGGAYAGDRGT